MHAAGQRRSDLWILGIGALSIRLAYLVAVYDQIGARGSLQATPDTVGYLTTARALVTGTGDFNSGALTWGPGYATFLAGFLRLLGEQALPILLVQCLLSALSVVFIYLLAWRLIGSRLVSLIAGIVAATSITSITLANLILSDSLFFFLMSACVLSLVLAMQDGSRCQFLTFGILAAIAMHVRPIGYLWPVACLIAGLAALALRRRDRPGSVSLRVSARHIVVACAIPMVLSGAWTLRNWIVADLPGFSWSVAGGPANIALDVSAESEGISTDSARVRWFQEFTEQHPGTELSKGVLYRIFAKRTLDVLEAHSIDFSAKYGRLIGDNVVALSELQDVTTPRWAGQVGSALAAFKKLRGQYLAVLMSLAGLTVLASRRMLFAFIQLATILLFYALMIGFTCCQGSRLFFPAQIAWSILTAVVAASIVEAASKLWARLSLLE